MKKVHFLIATLSVVSFLVLASCSKEKSKESNVLDDENVEIIGTSKFLSSLCEIKPSITKSGEMTEEEARTLLAPAIEASILYLKDNEYYAEDEFSMNDPRIIWIATGLAEYETKYQNTTKSSMSGCVLDALGINDFINASGKALAKAIAKQALKKSIPYIAAAISAVDFIICVTEQTN